MRTASKHFTAVAAFVLSGCRDAPSVADGSFDDSSSDATTRCAPTAPFSAPAKIVELASDRRDTVPRLTADELTLVYARQASNFPGDFDYDLYIATRSSTAEAFGAPVPITQLNTTATETNPALSSDGLSLYFNAPSGGVDLFVSTRSSSADMFGPGTPLVELNTASVDTSPFITSDGSELWFASDNFDLFRARWIGTQFGEVTRLDALNSDSVDMYPVLTADNLGIYLASSRPGGMGELDVWRSSRSTTSEMFPAPVLVPELSSSTDDYPGWLSPDGCRFYLSSGREGVHALFVATREP